MVPKIRKMEWKPVLYGLLVLICFSETETKKYNRCELARELVDKHQFDRTFLSSCKCDHEFYNRCICSKNVFIFTPRDLLGGKREWI